MKKLLLGIECIFMLLICSFSYSANGDILWTFDTGGTISSDSIIGNAAIDNNGTIYITADNKTFAISATGVKLWEYEGGWVNSSPALGKNGLLFIGMGNKLSAINSATGSLVWEKVLSGVYGGVYNTPAIGSDGTIYVGADNGSFYSLNPLNGDIKWTFTAGFMLAKVSPVIDNEGIIYFAQDSGKKIYALYDNGTLKWTYHLPQTANTYSPIVLGSDDTLYMGIDGELYAINRDNGSVKWHSELDNGILSENTPAVGCNDIIFIGSGYGNLYAVNKNGVTLWKFKTSTDSYGSYISTNLTIGDDNTIYFGIYGGSEIHILYALDINGTEKWHINFDGYKDNLQTSVAIGNNGNLYIGIDKKLYAIESSSTGLANCPWPAWRHNNGNSGNIDNNSSEQPANECSANQLSLCLTLDNCTDAGGYWYDNKCNEEQQTVLLSIASGWSLHSIPFKINNGINIENFTNNNISTIWKWTGNSWKIWSPDSNITNLITSYGLNNITIILQGEGFWINAKNSFDINLGTGDEYGLETLNISNGWNLKGIGKNCYKNELSNLGVNVKTVWKWTGNSWKIWSPDSNVNNLIASYGLDSIKFIQRGEGFWVNK